MTGGKLVLHRNGTVVCERDGSAILNNYVPSLLFRQLKSSGYQSTLDS
jgi:hypothetical protein